MAKTDQKFRSGYAALIGAPNVGKSTLLNRILGEKISIVTPKPQTTRGRVLGVVHRPGAQLVLVDTPGIHKGKTALNRHMVETAYGAIREVDVVVFVIDAARPDPESEELVLAKLRERERPALLAVNKMDAVPKIKALPLIAAWSDLHVFKEIVPVSAKEGDQVDVLVDAMFQELPPGHPYFPEDALTDMSEREAAREIIREKLFLLTGDEIPYSTAVTIESYTERENPRLVRIEAVIHVERESQKGIVIGKNGVALKEIGTQARLEIERMTGCKTHLALFVRVEKNWSKDPKAMRRLGYE
jgi:GTP-binding protein Era